MGAVFEGRRRAAVCMADASSFARADLARPRTVVLAAANSDFNKVAANAGAISLGSILGLCCGKFARVLGETAAVTVGAMVVALQLMCWKGYAEVHWGAIERDVMHVFDRNRDGVVDRRDASHALHRVNTVLTTHMGTSAAGFTGGFLYGLKG